MNVPGYPNPPDDPARREYEKLLDQQRRLLGGKTIAEFDAEYRNANEPWTQAGVSKQLWDQIHGLKGQQDTFEGLAGIGALAKAAKDAEEHDRLIGRGAGTLSPDWIAPPPFVDHGAEHRRRENEKVELQRRTTAALERALIESREREEKAQGEKAESEAREMRWKMIGALGLIAGLLLTAFAYWKDWLG